MAIFNLSKFRSKKEDLVFCKNQIYICDNNIQFKDKRLEKYIDQCCSSLKIYSDKPYIEVYREYKKRYSLYDRVPGLLFYRVIKLILKLYPNLSERPRFSDCIPNLIINDLIPKIPDEWLIPEEISSMFRDLWLKVEGYLSKEHPSIEELEIILNHCWAQEYEAFVINRDQKSDSLFMVSGIGLIKKFAMDKQSEVCIHNIINRYISETTKNIEQDEQ